MRKNFKTIASAVTLVSAIALILLITSTIASVKNQTEANCFHALEETTSRLGENLKKSIETDHTILDAMASVIAVDDDVTDESICTIINTYSTEASYVSYVELLRDDNTMLDSDGTVRDVSSFFDFEEESKKGSYISDICMSSKYHDTKIIRNAVPVLKNNETIAMLYGVVDLSEFEKNYKTNIYDGNAYVYLIDGNTGDFFLDTWHNSFGNISDFFNRETVSGDRFQEVDQKMKNGLTGDSAFVSQSTGDTIYLHYEPVGINNWSVMVTVQDRYALKESNEINNKLFIMAALCGIIVFFYMGFVTISLLNAYHRIRDLGMRDQTTGLQNRNAYDAYLSIHHQKTFDLVSCIFVDVNGLHELNNNKGHDAGDAMLRRVAETMQDIFGSDTLFRTGGDEFVVIMYKMDEDTANAKAKEMNDQIIANGYSVSYGIATEENVTDISKLISQADEKMLENKKLYYSIHERRMR